MTWVLPVTGANRARDAGRRVEHGASDTGDESMLQRVRLS